MAHTFTHGSVLYARLYSKFWDMINIFDNTIFEQKHNVIWAVCFLFTVSFPFEPVAVGVLGVLFGFWFSKYLDKKGYFIDKKMQHLRSTEIKVSEVIKELELEKEKLAVEKERLLVEKMRNETEISTLNVIDHKSKVEHTIAARFRGTDGHGNPIDNDGENIF